MTSRKDPFSDIEEILDLVMGDVDVEGSTGPPVDVADAGDAFVVAVDLPGYERDDIDVRLPDSTTLSLSATRDTEAVAEADRYVSRERRRESVSRQVGLPEPVAVEEATADYQGGVLTVTLPKQSGGDDTAVPVE